MQTYTKESKSVLQYILHHWNSLADADAHPQQLQQLLPTENHQENVNKRKWGN